VVCGSNYWDAVTNDAVLIVRGGVGTGAPYLAITTTPHTVAYAVASATVAGTNNQHIAGNLWWVNHRHPGDVVGTPPGFAAAVANLEHGDNNINVSGTNMWGQPAADSVTIHRETFEEAAPQIATNALIFPAAGSVLTAYGVTNVIWRPDAISDPHDGTNVILTLISVLDALDSNEFAVVTNNVSNVVGHVSWSVPMPPYGQTTYVMRFEVVDSTSLTNSRVFLDNVFTIVPEPVGLGGMLALLTICTRQCGGRNARGSHRA